MCDLCFAKEEAKDYDLRTVKTGQAMVRLVVGKEVLCEESF
jgi:hypothetical protein